MPCGASTAHLLVPCPRHRLLQSRSLSCCACAPVSLPWHSACGITGIFSKFYCHAQFFVLLSSQGETWWKCFSLLWFQWREVFPCWVPKGLDALTWRCPVRVLFELLVKLAECSGEDKEDMPPSSWHAKARTAKTASPCKLICECGFIQNDCLSMKSIKATETYLRSFPTA